MDDNIKLPSFTFLFHDHLEMNYHLCNVLLIIVGPEQKLANMNLIPGINAKLGGKSKLHKNCLLTSTSTPQHFFPWTYNMCVHAHINYSKQKSKVFNIHTIGLTFLKAVQQKSHCIEKWIQDLWLAYEGMYVTTVLTYPTQEYLSELSKSQVPFCVYWDL